MKKLYEVEMIMMVMAEDESDAKLVAAQNASAENWDEFDAYEADSVKSEWWDCIPWGSDDDKTCGEIILGMRSRKFKAKGE